MKIVNKVVRFVKSNSPNILTGGAIVGTVATAFLTGRASYNAALDIHKEFGPDASNKEKVGFVWKRYIPAGAAGVATIACIVGSNRVGNRRLLAATMAYTIADQAFDQYKEKVVEQLGENKEKAIRDEIAKDKVLSNPTNLAPVEVGVGVHCCELYTGRYFVSNMETLQRAANEVNARMLIHDICNLDEFYYAIGLNPTRYSGEMGWKTPKLMKLEFTTVMSDKGYPCIAFDYNYISPLD